MSKINTYPNAWDLHYFQEIVKTQNLSRAAERLGVTQSALSLSVKRLEECLGEKIFFRKNRGLDLTPAGLRLARESNRLLESWENILAETKRSQTELKGQFTLGCHPAVGSYTLGFVLPEIYRKYPDIDFKLVHDSSLRICDALISGKMDFALLINPVRHPDLVIHPIGKDRVTFWQANKGAKDVLIYNPEMLQSQSLIKKIPSKLKFERHLMTTSLELAARMTGYGMGIGLLPTRIAQAEKINLRKVPNAPFYQDVVTFVYRVDLPKFKSTKLIIDKFKAINLT